MSPLADSKLKHCSKDTAPLGGQDLVHLLAETPGWTVISDDNISKLEKTWTFPDFANAQAFSLQVGELAEAADHHPAILLEWGRVTVTWWTHTIGGLHTNDFIMAARCNRLG